MSECLWLEQAWTQPLLLIMHNLILYILGLVMHVFLRISCMQHILQRLILTIVIATTI